VAARQGRRLGPGHQPPGVLDYWETRVRENGRFENVYTLGMRGIHDSGMPGGGTIDEKRQRLEKIISLQRDMLARHVNQHVETVPQIFCPYKEVLDIYRSGMTCPTTSPWSGPTTISATSASCPTSANARAPGRSGVYYHISYNGRPHDYLWLESIPPALIWHEMTKAYELGADRLWVVNVGDIKPPKRA
jgi:hypothetical protein